MAGLLSILAVAGLLHLSPLPQDAFPSSFVEQISGRFEAGGMVAIRVANGVRVEVDGRALKVHNNLVIFGYGRDASGPSEIILTKKGFKQKLVKQIQPGVYDIEYVEGVDAVYVSPPAAVRERIAREAKQKRIARRSLLEKPELSEGFLVPSIGRISGVYGSQRFFNGHPKRPHFGLDIAAPSGTLVRATLPGRVSLAKSDMFYEGGLIFIDHGLDLMSAYLHLGEIKVKAGDVVQRGTAIATIGARQGRSTGAHLDWRLYWQNKRLNPIKVLDEKQLAKLK